LDQAPEKGVDIKRVASETIISLVVQGILALVLIVAMTWIVLSPVNDETSKAALVVVGSTVGFLFGKHS
jgi:hypothetical protein